MYVTKVLRGIWKESLILHWDVLFDIPSHSPSFHLSICDFSSSRLWNSRTPNTRRKSVSLKSGAARKTSASEFSARKCKYFMISPMFFLFSLFCCPWLSLASTNCSQQAVNLAGLVNLPRGLPWENESSAAFSSPNSTRGEDCIPAVLCVEDCFGGFHNEFIGG